MIDDPEFLARRTAYIETLRAMGRPIRMAGFAAIMGGVGLMFWARSTPTLPDWVEWAAYVLLAGGWTAFVYVVVRRSRWVRANPFDPAPDPEAPQEARRPPSERPEASP